MVRLVYRHCTDFEVLFFSFQEVEDFPKGASHVECISPLKLSEPLALNPAQTHIP